MPISTDYFIMRTLEKSPGKPNPLGTVIALNMIDAVSENLVTRKFVKDFYYCWHALVVSQNLSLNNDRELFGILDEMNEKPMCKASISSGRQSFLLEAVSSPPSIKSVDLYTVVTEHVFWNKLVDSGFKRRMGIDQITASAEAGGRNNYSFPDAESKKLPIKKGEILGKRVLWVSPMSISEVSKLLASAETACNCLGLIHHYNCPGLQLCALRLPDHANRLSPSARPTPGDAGSHTRFRVCSTRSHGAGRRKWGTAVDLAKLNHGSSNCDGKSERVFHPIKTDHLGALVKTSLGNLNTAPKLTLAQDDDKFADYVKGPVRIRWDSETIFSQLKAMGL